TGAPLRSRAQISGCRWRGRAVDGGRSGSADTGPRIPAQARGGQSLDPRHHAVDDLARGGQRLRQSHARDHRQISGGRIRRIAARPPRRRDRQTGFFNAEFFAPVKPADQWRPGLDKDALTGEILAKLEADFPGVEFNFSQYLQDNVAEAVSGVKGENSIKLFGNDLQTLSDTANKIKAVLATVRGITDLAVFTSLGQPTIQIDVDRARAAR